MKHQAKSGIYPLSPSQNEEEVVNPDVMCNADVAFIAVQYRSKIIQDWGWKLLIFLTVDTQKPSRHVPTV